MDQKCAVPERNDGTVVFLFLLGARRAGAPGGLLLALFVTAALAAPAPPVATYPLGAHHIWKVQAWFMTPLYRSTSTWRQHRAMAWGAVLDCVVTGERQERCAFADHEAYWGFILKDAQAPSLYAIDMQPALDLTWNAQGHLAKWDWVGDLTTFDDGVCGALGKMHWTGNGVIKSADDRRRVGQEMAEDLVHAILGALDVELPTPVAADGPWVLRDLPMATQRFPGTAGMSKIQARYAPVDEYSPNVFLEGSATVSPMVGGGTQAYQELLDVRGAAQIDADGRLTHSHVAVAVRQFGRTGDYELTDYKAELLDAVPATASERAPGPCPAIPE